jgi:hypothetical protein
MPFTTISLATAVILLAAAVAGGCAVHRNAVHEGRAFPVDRIGTVSSLVESGIDREQVRRHLGPPYATGIDADGRPFWEYRYRGQSTTSAGGGLLLVGVVASQSQVGAEARVVFDGTGRVLQVVWEIAGADAYRRLVLEEGQ